MIRCAFLSVGHLDDYVVDDDLAVQELIDAGWDMATVPWDATETDWSTFDIAIIRSTWDYQDKMDLFLDTLKHINKSTRLENPLDIVTWNINKSYLVDLEQKDVHIVPTSWGNHLNSDVLNSYVSYYKKAPFVIKPQVGASSKNTFLLTPDHIDNHSDQVIAAFENKAYMVQPFMHHIVKEG